MNTVLFFQAAQPEMSIWGIIIPAAVFIISFLVTLMLYRHFARQEEE